MWREVRAMEKKMIAIDESIKCLEITRDIYADRAGVRGVKNCEDEYLKLLLAISKVINLRGKSGERF